MTMRDYLVDLYQHQAWADAELWRAFEGHPGAFADKALWDRLHHIHVVQQFFLAVVRSENVHAMKITKPEDFATPADLKAHALEYHAAAAEFLKNADDETFERPVNIPWFKDPSLDLPIGQALVQVAMHSHYHRGQNATRLRELGGAPPLTDYIVWIWRGKAAPRWT